MTTEFTNPYETRWHKDIMPEYHLWEIMKGGGWFRNQQLKVILRGKNVRDKLTAPMRNINNMGLIPHPPDYPNGRWHVKAERGRFMLEFNEKVAQFDTEIVKKVVDERVNAQVDEAVKKSLEVHTQEHMALINKQIEEMRKSSVPILELVRHDDKGKRKVEVIQPAHENMPYLMYLLNVGEHTYLHGEAGSGKSTAAWMAAKALKRRYGYISLTPQTFESRLFGFLSPTGKYVTTDFRECYEKGGVFCVDEMDNGSGNLYTAFNGALENNLCAFPDKQVKRHEDFVVVGTGNTSGGGPNAMFPTRRPFDKAFAERFSYIEWGYDERLERVVAMSINPEVAPVWHEYMLKLRAYCRQHHPMVLVSPRAVFKGCKYLRDQVMPLHVMMHAVIFKGYDRASVNSILAANPVPTKELDAAVQAHKNAGHRTAKKGTREHVN